MRARFAAALAAGALAFPGCNPPKYVTYVSLQRDWAGAVPWGWNVMAEAQNNSFTQVNLIGPFDPAFYLGAPSFSVRWHSYDMPRRLPDGLVESFPSADAYIQEMIDGVYGPDHRFEVPVHEIRIDGKRRMAKHFVVWSPVPVDRSARYGVAVDQVSGATLNPRKHAYVIVPMRRGFYVLVYPATVQGFKFYEPQFNQLVNSFRPLTEGPGGPKVPVAASAAAAPDSPAPPVVKR